MLRPLRAPPPAQVSAGLVLPTLLVWRAQWQAAREWASEQQAREQPWQQPRQRRRWASGSSLAAPRQTTVAEMELAASQYATVAAPALQAADAFPGGWATVALAAGLLAWVAGVLLRHRWAAPCGA